MRILVASNDASLAETLDLRLSAEGFAVDTIDTAEDALEDLRIVDFDLVVIDDDLADTIGAALLRKMRARQIKTPASMLTTRTCGMAHQAVERRGRRRDRAPLRRRKSWPGCMRWSGAPAARPASWSRSGLWCWTWIASKS